MTIEQALKIVRIVHCDICGYERCLSYTPTKADIDEAMQMVESFVGAIIYEE